MAREHGLVAGHSRDALAQGFAHYPVACFGVVNHLHYQICFRIVQNILGAVGEQTAVYVHGARFVDVAHTDAVKRGVGVSCVLKYGP